MGQPETSRRSMYAAIRLAVLVFKVRARFQVRANGRDCPRSLSCLFRLPSWKSRCIQESISRVLRDPHRAHRQYYNGGKKCKPEHVKEVKVGTEQLFDELESSKPSNLSLRRIAADDRLLLSHNILAGSDTASTLPQLSRQLELTTLLLSRLQAAQNKPCDVHASCEGGASIAEDCRKLVANLEHLLRYLQEATLIAIVELILELIGEDTLYWYEYWKRYGRGEDGWFEEWPNGRHPLSTTWPWNIKPSLLVLWGVCWMFLNNEAGIYWEPRDVNQSVDAWPVEWPPRPAPAILRFINPGQNVDTYDSGATGGNIRGANRFDTSLPCAPRSPLYSYNNLAGYSDLEVPSEWPGFEGTQLPNPTYDLDSGFLENSEFLRDFLDEPAVIRPVTDSPDVLEHPNECAIPDQHVDPFEPQALPPSQVSAPVGVGFTLRTPRPGILSFPMTARSECSDATVSPVALKLQLQHADPSSDETREESEDIPKALPTSRNDGRSEEPPRNADGKIYCDDLACVRDPPTFQRKCEWTKHRDKHLRPFHCSEPGCLKIQGFTYSGGLLRHQREVHNQHGGPKAPMQCPHQDCKRSSGGGFSRKENLYEHLRRVHRGAGIPGEGSRGNRRKRKRELEEDDGRRRVFVDGGDQELREEVGRLRRELRVKDERVRLLEEMLRSFRESLERKVGKL